ncbi:MAG: hypothetical protein ACOX7F_06625 [Eubacteriales bacterium]
MSNKHTADNQASQQLYQQIYQSAQNGLHAIDAARQTLGPEDPMVSQLANQRKCYSDLICKSALSLRQMGTTAHRDNPFQRMQTKASVTAGILMKKTPSHAAEILIHNATSGIADLQQALNHSPQANADSQALSREFLSAQQNYIDQMKKFL